VIRVKRLSAVVSDEDYKRVEKLVKAGAAASIAQLVRDAVDEYADKLDAGKLLNLRTVPLEQARKEVEKYLKDHPGLVWPDEMAEELGLDYRIVLSVVRDLLQEGRAEEAKAQVVEA
jgi:ribosome biogenesis GTPase A